MWSKLAPWQNNMTKRILLIPIFFLVLSLAFLVLTPISRAKTDATPIRLRIGVTHDGVTRITSDDLQAAGVDITAIDPRTFAMSSRGQPVAIRVAGEEDGSFDEGDFILFFGQKFHGSLQEEKYTDENVCWLETG